MSNIILDVKQTKLTLISPKTLVGTQVEYNNCIFSFDEEWAGYAKTAVFYSDKAEIFNMFLDENDNCIVPWETMKNPCILYIGVFGIKDDVEIPTNFILLRVLEGSAGGNAPPPPTIDVYAQLLNHINSFNFAEASRAASEGSTDPRSGRLGAELEREDKENLRALAEESRVNTEGDSTKGRVKAENDRVLAEAARVNAEGDSTKGRVKAENDRVLAEAARVNAEGDNTKGRVKAENDRVLAEAARVSDENERAVFEAYDAGKTYNKSNKVFYQGSSYRCKQNTIAGTIPTNTTYWQIIAQKGEDTISISFTQPNGGIWLEEVI